MKIIITVICACSLFLLISCSGTKKTAVTQQALNNKMDTIDAAKLFNINVDSIKLAHKNIILTTSKGDTIRITDKTRRIKTTVNGNTIKVKQTEYYIYVDEGYVSIIGDAKEAKGGAFVESDSAHFYFIKNLYSWPENIHGKKIRVTGKCITVDRKKLMDERPWIQGRKIERILENAKWVVIE